MAGVDEVVLVGEAKHSAIDTPFVEELAGIGIFVEDIGSAYVESQLLLSHRFIVDILTLQNMNTLSTEVILVGSTVVDIP